MSFGFGVGDFLASLKIIKHICEAIKSGPDDFKELLSELESFHSILQSLSNNTKDKDSMLNRQGTAWKKELMGLVKNSEHTLNEIRCIINKHSSLSNDLEGRVIRIWDAYRVGSSNIGVLGGRLTFHISAISNFLVSMQGSAINRIEKMIDCMYSKTVNEDTLHHKQSQVSLVSIGSSLSGVGTDKEEAWKLLKHHLLEDGISIEQVLAHRQKIIDYTKLLLDGSAGDVFNPKKRILSSWAEGRARIELSLIADRNGVYNGQECCMVLFHVIFHVERSFFPKRTNPFISGSVEFNFAQPKVLRIAHTYEEMSGLRTVHSGITELGKNARLVISDRSMEPSWGGQKKERHWFGFMPYRTTLGLIIQTSETPMTAQVKVEGLRASMLWDANDSGFQGPDNTQWTTPEYTETGKGREIGVDELEKFVEQGDKCGWLP